MIFLIVEKCLSKLITHPYYYVINFWFFIICNNYVVREDLRKSLRADPLSWTTIGKIMVVCVIIDVSIALVRLYLSSQSGGGNNGIND